MTVLRLVTPGPPAPPHQPHHGPRHGYRCGCTPCETERAERQPARCVCLRQAAYRDPTSDGDLTCLNCGRPATAPVTVATLTQAA